MSNSAAARRKEQADIIKKLQDERKALSAQKRRQTSGTGPVSYGVVSTNIAGFGGFNPNINIDTGKLDVGGGVMMGPIAYNPQQKTISSGTLTISGLLNQSSSWIICLGEGAAADDLVTIAGASFSGQILYLQAQNNDITIKHNTGNIFTHDGNDVVLSGYNSGTNTGGEVAILIFDNQVVDTSSGKWVVVATHGGTAASSWVGTATSDLDMGTYDINNVVDIGTALNPVDNIYIERLRFETGTGVSNIPNIYSANGNDIDFNVTSSLYKFSFRFGGTTRFEVDNNSITVVNTAIIGDGTSGNGAVVLNDSTSMVGAANGYVYREGSDVKIYTGGSEKNISNMLASNQSVTITGGWTFNSILNVYPALDSTYALGSSTVRFDEIYADDIISGSIGEGANFGCVISFSSTGINLITNSNDRVSISPGGTSDFDFENGQLNLNSSTVINHTATTTAPTTAGTYNQYIVSPIGYISIKVNGTSYKVPYYT